MGCYKAPSSPLMGESRVFSRHPFRPAAPDTFPMEGEDKTPALILAFDGRGGAKRLKRVFAGQPLPIEGKNYPPAAGKAGSGRLRQKAMGWKSIQLMKALILGSCARSGSKTR